jgi:hypothetical protein
MRLNHPLDPFNAAESCVNHSVQVSLAVFESGGATILEHRTAATGGTGRQNLTAVAF